MSRRKTQAFPQNLPATPEAPASPLAPNLISDLFSMFAVAVKENDYNGAARIAHELIAARALSGPDLETAKEVLVDNGKYRCPGCGQRLKPLTIRVVYEDKLSSAA